MVRIIDFRSDTVTKPSPEMWQAIKTMDNSKLGDDVSEEDPTVNALEKKAAKLVGKEAALFVTSGTMGNLLAILSQTHPGDEILVEEHSHIFTWEVGGAARLGGVMVHPYPSLRGNFLPIALQPLIRPRDDIHQPFTTLITLENTHTYHGGSIIDLEVFESTREFASQNQMCVHLDGARIFNAVIARQLAVTDYTQYVDTVQFCLSKGLSCPVGSILAGSKDTIHIARKYRKMLGGGWRQAGILASMGLVALEASWIRRLEDDHKLAQYLAGELADLSLPIVIPEPETNVVMLGFINPVDVVAIVHRLEKAGIRTHDIGPCIRFVTYYGLTKEDVDYSISVITRVLTEVLSKS